MPKYLVGLIIAMGLFAACTPQPSGRLDAHGRDEQGRLWPRNDLPGAANFAEVAPGLYRGAQPTAEGFAFLRRQLGIKTIINLCASDDRPMLAGLDLDYVHLPMNAWNIRGSTVEQAVAVARDPARQPVFVHCQRGADRTGCVVGAYRILAQGWTAQEAKAELPRFRFAAIFQNIPAYLNDLPARRDAAHDSLIHTPTGN